MPRSWSMPSSESVHTAMRRRTRAVQPGVLQCLPIFTQRRRPPCGASSGAVPSTPFGQPPQSRRSTPFGTSSYPFEPLGGRVWRLRDSITVYDAWYVALAEWLSTDLVTPDTATAAGDRTPLSSADPRLSRGTRASTPLQDASMLLGRPKTSAALTAMRRSFRRLADPREEWQERVLEWVGAPANQRLSTSQSPTLSSSESAEPPSAVGRRGNSSSDQTLITWTGLRVQATEHPNGIEPCYRLERRRLGR